MSHTKFWVTLHKNDDNFIAKKSDTFQSSNFGYHSVKPCLPNFQYRITNCCENKLRELTCPKIVRQSFVENGKVEIRILSVLLIHGEAMHVSILFISRMRYTVCASAHNHRSLSLPQMRMLNTCEFEFTCSWTEKKLVYTVIRKAEVVLET